MGRLQAGEEDKKRRGRGGAEEKGRTFGEGERGRGEQGERRPYKYLVTISV